MASGIGSSDIDTPTDDETTQPSQGSQVHAAWARSVREKARCFGTATAAVRPPIDPFVDHATFALDKVDSARLELVQMVCALADIAEQAS